MRGYRSLTFVYVGVATMGLVGCGNDPASGPDDAVATVEVALTTVPTSVQCIRLTATPSSGSATNKTFTVTAGNPSTNLQMGQLAQGNYTMTGDAFTVACTSISGAAPWIADPVPLTLRAGTPAVITMTFRKNPLITVNANFLNNVQSVVTSFNNTYVVTDAGIVQAGSTGLTFQRQSFAAFDSSSTPGNAIATMAASYGGACAIRVDGTIWCFGFNSFGELGPGVPLVGFSPPTQLTALTAASQIAGGLNHFCAQASGPSGVRVYCWGHNDSGQLGNGTTTDSANPVVAFSSATRSLACGASSSYVVGSNGVLSAWGNNASGQLGDGTTVNRTSPVTLQPLSENGGIQGVSAGSTHACLLRADGSLRCWGNNASGQLGNGSTTNSSAPVVVSGSLNAKQIALGNSHSCAVTTGGQSMCWGINGLGQIGDATVTNRLVPTATSLGTILVTSLGIGIADTTCAIASTLDLYCWGSNQGGTLGDGTNNAAFTPIRPILQ